MSLWFGAILAFAVCGGDQVLGGIGVAVENNLSVRSIPFDRLFEKWHWHPDRLVLSLAPKRRSTKPSTGIAIPVKTLTGYEAVPLPFAIPGNF